MPNVMRFVQGTKKMVCVPKAHTLTLHFIDGEKYPHTIYLPAWILNNANPPRDHGKRGKRMAKRRQKSK